MLDQIMNFFNVFQELQLGKKRTKRTTKEQDEEQASNLTKILGIVQNVVKLQHPRAARTAYFGVSVIISAIVPEMLQVRASTKT